MHTLPHKTDTPKQISKCVLWCLPETWTQGPSNGTAARDRVTITGACPCFPSKHRLLVFPPGYRTVLCCRSTLPRAHSLVQNIDQDEAVQSDHLCMALAAPSVSKRRQPANGILAAWLRDSQSGSSFACQYTALSVQLDSSSMLIFLDAHRA